MSQTIENRIKNRIYGKGRGYAFTPKSFSDLGSADGIRKSLSRLVKEGMIRRLSRGLYDYPQKHATLGELPPDIQQVGKAIAEKFSITLQPSGAYAANLLGLSEQVPAKIVFLTEGASKAITVGNKTLHLKKTTPKNMKTAGSITGVIIQALKFIGQEGLTDKDIEKLREILSEDDIRRIKLDAHLAPDWIKKILDTITETKDG